MSKVEQEYESSTESDQEYESSTESDQEDSTKNKSNYTEDNKVSISVIERRLKSIVKKQEEYNFTLFILLLLNVVIIILQIQFMDKIISKDK